MLTVPMPTAETAETAFRKLVSDVLERCSSGIQRDVERLRTKHPHMSDRELANIVVARYRRRAGCAGALTGAGGAITMPVTIPAGVLTSWVIATQTVLAVATVYDYSPDDEQLLFDVMMVIAADSVVATLQQMTSISAQHVSKRAIQKYVTREVMVHINKVVPRKVLTKAGQQSLTSFTKLAPLVGAPVGYCFEHVFITGVGRKAIAWYSLDADLEPSVHAAA